jgi:hypothetical protein
MSDTAQPPTTGRPAPPAAAKKPLTARPHKPCSHPPKPRTGAYDRRPGAGPGRARHRTQCHGDGRRPVRVVLPDEPPVLTPAAARTLLRVLLKAHAAQNDREEGDRS